MFQALIAVLLLTTACKPRTYNAGAQSWKFDFGSAKTVTLPSGGTWVFHWTNNDVPDAKGYIRQAVENSVRNAQANPITGDTMVGHGFYVAGDPFQSWDYGKNLVAVKLAPKAPLLCCARDLDLDEEKIKFVKSPAEALMYYWEKNNSMAQDNISFGSAAIVFRKPSIEKGVLDLNSAKVLLEKNLQKPSFLDPIPVPNINTMDDSIVFLERYLALRTVMHSVLFRDGMLKGTTNDVGEYALEQTLEAELRSTPKRLQDAILRLQSGPKASSLKACAKSADNGLPAGVARTGYTNCAANFGMPNVKPVISIDDSEKVLVLAEAGYLPPNTVPSPNYYMQMLDHYKKNASKNIIAFVRALEKFDAVYSKSSIHAVLRNR